MTPARIFDERGLARAVLAEERMDLAGPQVEVHSAEGSDSPEPLRYRVQAPPAQWPVALYVAPGAGRSPRHATSAAVVLLSAVMSALRSPSRNGPW